MTMRTLRRADEVSAWIFFFTSRRRHTRLQGDWSSDVCSSDLHVHGEGRAARSAMTDSPIMTLRKEYDAIARQLEGGGGTAGAEREAAKREIIEIGRASCRERV